jgi:hypothetical protein
MSYKFHSFVYGVNVGFKGNDKPGDIGSTQSMEEKTIFTM